MLIGLRWCILSARFLLIGGLRRSRDPRRIALLGHRPPRASSLELSCSVEVDVC